MLKMKGHIKWYNNVNHYGYIIGSDNQTYFFESLYAKNIDYHENDIVLFVPYFNNIPYAKKVKLVKVGDHYGQ